MIDFRHPIRSLPLSLVGLAVLVASFAPAGYGQTSSPFVESDTGYAYGQTDVPRRPVATYSIVARDSVTGQMGVAVQSHWFSVGSVVPWARAGVGAVATQSFVDPRYGPLGLELMHHGRTAEEALNALVSTDAARAVRQVAMVDAEGRVAAHTGENAIQAAGHQTGNGYSVQANLMESDKVWGAMAKAYETSEGDLAARLVAALEAAQDEGGDIRGKQSAALLIVGPESTGQPWNDRIFDLRVEDHPEPVQELKRLVRLQRAYQKLNEGDGHVTEGNIESAMESYRTAMGLVPDSATNGEAPFWVGITLASEGRVDEAIPFLRRAFAQDERWAELVERLPAAGLLPSEDLAKTLKKRMKADVEPESTE
ncbi:Zn-dependent protease [Longibacter salinarum]|uniref:Zn-dependent protease n=1 Tax=Longibacter salinarum TaxID=1850348 RepID=A0A2A8CVY7_9BACT|nr:DUF1028 domain-containing protein [Longibacter salinarum]PEN12754.1 Zn-dependent protease [Longibacter salinarum]